MGYEIYILIYNDDSYSASKSNYLNIKLSKNVPFDTNTKLFKKFTHEIQYKPKQYIGNEYSLYIYDKNAWLWYKYRFAYYKPKTKVGNVELYFSNKDPQNTTPLVVGFKEDNNETVKYYTYKGLMALGNSYYDVPSGYFQKNDLLARLTEELSLFTGKRKKKMVIRSEFKLSVGDDNLIYPDSGVNPKKITITKSAEPAYEDFEKYEHSINPASTVSSFYLGINNDAMYIDAEKEFKKGIKCAEIYFSKKFNTELPLMVKFVGKDPDGHKKNFSIRELLSTTGIEIKLESITEVVEDNLRNKFDEEIEFLQGIIWRHIDRTDQHSKIASFSLGRNNISDSYVEYSHTRNINLKNKKLKIFLKNQQIKLGGKDHLDQIMSLGSYYLRKGPEKNEYDDTPFMIKVTKQGGFSGSVLYYSKKSDNSVWTEIKIRNIIDLLLKLREVNNIGEKNQDFPKFREEVFIALNKEGSLPIIEQDSLLRTTGQTVQRGNTNRGGVSRGSFTGGNGRGSRDRGANGRGRGGSEAGRGGNGGLHNTGVVTSNTLHNEQTPGGSLVSKPTLSNPVEVIPPSKDQIDVSVLTEEEGGGASPDSPLLKNGENENFFSKHWIIFAGAGGGLVLIIVIIVIVVYKKCVKVRTPPYIEPLL